MEGTVTERGARAEVDEAARGPIDGPARVVLLLAIAANPFRARVTVGTGRATMEDEVALGGLRDLLGAAVRAREVVIVDWRDGFEAVNEAADRATGTDATFRAAGGSIRLAVVGRGGPAKLLEVEDGAASLRTGLERAPILLRGRVGKADVDGVGRDEGVGNADLVGRPGGEDRTGRADLAIPSRR